MTDLSKAETHALVDELVRRMTCARCGRVGATRRCPTGIGPGFGGCVLEAGHMDDNQWSSHLSEREAYGYRKATGCTACPGPVFVPLPEETEEQ